MFDKVILIFEGIDLLLEVEVLKIRFGYIILVIIISVIY